MTMTRISPLLLVGICAAGASAAACSSSNNNATPAPDASAAGANDGSTAPADATGSSDSTTPDGSASPADASAGDTSPADAGADVSPAVTISETPPMGGASVEAWLATGAYKLWQGEPAIHAARPPSPHGFNRIYSNTIVSDNATATGPWPMGAAAVKEIYNAITDTTPAGYAVYLKTQADSAGGASWYWYERVPLTSTAPHDDAGVVADGFGVPDGGPPTTICVGCHDAAGSDSAHTPSPNSHDEVYTPVGGPSDAGTTQTPPMGGANVEAWLATQLYKQWQGEPAIHAARSPSPHGFNRIYSNAIINENATATAPWPMGAAAVKEIYNALTDTSPAGYAVYLKTQADSAGGANWYWYERVPLTSTAPHDDAGVVADGFGVPDGGPPTTICVGCHDAAGMDPAHTPSPNGHDEVYTPVP
jgi:hypothetical protein